MHVNGSNNQPLSPTLWPHNRSPSMDGRFTLQHARQRRALRPSVWCRELREITLPDLLWTRKLDTANKADCPINCPIVWLSYQLTFCSPSQASLSDRLETSEVCMCVVRGGGGGVLAVSTNVFSLTLFECDSIGYWRCLCVILSATYVVCVSFYRLLTLSVCDSIGYWRCLCVILCWHLCVVT